MPTPKPRVLAGTIRPVGRDTYDFRAAAAIPSATGGAPSSGPSGVLAAATGNEVAQVPELKPAEALGPAPRDVRQVEQMVAQGSLRYARQGTLSRVPLMNRSIQDYTQNNQEIVNETKAFLDAQQAQGMNVLQGVFEDTDQMARWAVAQIIRSFEPGPVPSVPDFIHQSREGRRVMAL